MSVIPLCGRAIPGNGGHTAGRAWTLLLAAALLLAMLALASCAPGPGQDAREAQDIVQAYLQAQQSGDLEGARSYWTDINNPGGPWTLVPGRDMEHVTREHNASFAGGVEIVQSEYESFRGLDKPIGVLRMELRVQPEGKIRKIETGLVQHEGRWYIYSMYPGTW